MGISGKALRLALGKFRTESIFDSLVSRLRVDPEHPDWTPALRRLHEHSRKRRLQIVPDFFYTPVFSPAALPPSVWEGSFPECGNFDLEAQRAFLRETPTFQEELEALPTSR
jgi:hypothetical protein